MPINADTVYSAAKNGHIHCLNYLIEEKNCPVNELACTWAAKQGHLDCLRYLHEHGAIFSVSLRTYMTHILFFFYLI